jgi:pyrroline-5-carboxylate reductase
MEKRVKSILNTTIGFIGAGGIASALAKGFCASENFSGKIFMHNRSPEKTLAMKELFPDRICVAESNQELKKGYCTVGIYIKRCEALLLLTYSI